MQEKVLTEQVENIFVVQINRPAARNAVDSETAHLLAQAFEHFEQTADLKVAVLAGVGGCFCAGADLKAVSKGELVEKPNPEPAANPASVKAPMGPTYLQLSKPVIAAVSGYAVAGGLELAVWCDLRVAEAGATFGVFCRRWGVPLVDGGTVRLPRLIGHSNALDMILTGRPVDAEEAKQMGLANRVVKDGTALTEAIKLAKQIADFPQECMKNDRASSYMQWSMPLQEALAHEAKAGLRTIESGESLEGATRFKDGAGRSGDFNNLR